MKHFTVVVNHSHCEWVFYHLW